MQDDSLDIIRSNSARKCIRIYKSSHQIRGNKIIIRWEKCSIFAMTSSEGKNNVTSMKQKLINHVSPAKEETRSFLNFSRENLSISHCDLEEGFNSSRLKPSRHMILSITALTIAVICLGLESWELHCSLSKLHDIEQLKRDVETLKHRFLEQDLLDELKAFEQVNVLAHIRFTWCVSFIYLENKLHIVYIQCCTVMYSIVCTVCFVYILSIILVRIITITNTVSLVINTHIARIHSYVLLWEKSSYKHVTDLSV